MNLSKMLAGDLAGFRCCYPLTWWQAEAWLGADALRCDRGVVA